MMKNTNMASSLLSLFFTILVVLSATNTTPVSAATFKEVKVGGHYGWRVPPTNETDFYINWASHKRFHVGDSLRFEYTNDSVLVVDKWGYYHCNSTHPYSSFKDGNTVVKLEKGGPIYFTSGEPDHCKDGQRLEVDVMDHHHPIPLTPSSIEAPAPSPSSVASVGPLKLFSELVLVAIIATTV